VQATNSKSRSVVDVTGAYIVRASTHSSLFTWLDDADIQSLLNTQLYARLKKPLVTTEIAQGRKLHIVAGFAAQHCTKHRNTSSNASVLGKNCGFKVNTALSTKCILRRVLLTVNASTKLLCIQQASGVLDCDRSGLR
jgi:hypothetical protein